MYRYSRVSWFWIGRVWFYWVRGKYSSPEFGFKYELITKAELARQNIHRKAEEENTRDNYSGGLKCQLIFRAPNLLSCFDVSLFTWSRVRKPPSPHSFHRGHVQSLGANKEEEKHKSWRTWQFKVVFFRSKKTFNNSLSRYLVDLYLLVHTYLAALNKFRVV